MTVWEIALMSARTGIATLLLASGVSKLVSNDRFAATLIALGVPPLYSRRVGVTAATLESLVGIVALVGIGVRFAETSMAVLASAFVAVNVFGVMRNPGHQCGCFGFLSKETFGARSLAKSILLCVVAVLVLAFNHDPAAYNLAYAARLGVLCVVGMLALTFAQAQLSLASIESSSKHHPRRARVGVNP